LLREIVWIGDTRKRLQAFPKEVQRSIGGALMLAQFGGTAEHVKPFKGVGSGVFEIVERYQTNAYRAVYAVQLGKRIYVLHTFQKKSKTGIKTPKAEVDLIKQRYAEAQEIAKHEQD
jgi:phage-related protein